METGNSTQTLPPPPRQVRRTGRSASSFGILRVFLIPAALGCLIIVLLILSKTYTAYRGTPVAARVTSKYTGHGSRGSTSYNLRYTYYLDGQTFTDSDSIGQDKYTQVQIGQTLDGRAIHIGGYGIFIDPLVSFRIDIISLLVQLLFWGAISSVIFYAAWVVPIRQLWIAQSGDVAAGKVIRRKILRGKQTRYTLTYEFQPAAGSTLAATTTVNRPQYAAAVEGTPLSILYDPQRPKWNLPWEFSGFEIKQ